MPWRPASVGTCKDPVYESDARLLLLLCQQPEGTCRQAAASGLKFPTQAQAVHFRRLGALEEASRRPPHQRGQQSGPACPFVGRTFPESWISRLNPAEPFEGNCQAEQRTGLASGCRAAGKTHRSPSGGDKKAGKGSAALDDQIWAELRSWGQPSWTPGVLVADLRPLKLISDRDSGEKDTESSRERPAASWNLRSQGTRRIS